MGQRLGTHIYNKSNYIELANCYHHWSAYTKSALRITIDIMENFIDFHNEDNDTMRAIKLFQSIGAGVIKEDYDTLTQEQQKYCHIGTNRNLGLISISKEQMKETDNWEEGRVEIYLTDNKDYFKGVDENRAYFGVYWYDTKECLEEEYEGKIDFDNLIEFDFDLDNMRLEDLRELYSRIDEIEDNYNGMFRIKGNNDIYCSIY